VEDITVEGDHEYEDVDHGVDEERLQQVPWRRSNVGSKKNQLWLEEHMRATLEEFDSSMNMQNSAMNHGILYSAFQEWCYGVRKSRKRGLASVLSPEEEEQIVECLVRMCKGGLGLTPIALKMKVYEITKHRETLFKNGISGDG
jgi:ADP-heptose:LPS heptosyltransferase